MKTLWIVVATIAMGVMIYSASVFADDPLPAGACCFEGASCDGSLVCKQEPCVLFYDPVTFVPVYVPGTCREWREGE